MDEVQQLLEVSLGMTGAPVHPHYGLLWPGSRSEVLGRSFIDFERKSITINHKVTEQLVNGKYVPVVSDVDAEEQDQLPYLPPILAVEEELLKQKEKQQLYRKLFKKSYSTEYLDFVCNRSGRVSRSGPNFADGALGPAAFPEV